jgi:ATP/maltotriose-dependent transcriptional regulator MalT
MSLQDLTKQEKIVAEMIARGMTRKAIAEELFISPATVATYMTNIYQKLFIENTQPVGKRAQLTEIIRKEESENGKANRYESSRHNRHPRAAALSVSGLASNEKSLAIWRLFHPWA